MGLKDFTLEELHDEMVRRETLEKLKNKPQQLENPDLTYLRCILTKYIDDIYDGKHYDVYEVLHFINVITLKAFYGKNVFHWIRENE